MPQYAVKTSGVPAGTKTPLHYTELSQLMLFKLSGSSQEKLEEVVRGEGKKDTLLAVLPPQS